MGHPTLLHEHTQTFTHAHLVFKPRGNCIRTSFLYTLFRRAPMHGYDNLLLDSVCVYMPFMNVLAYSLTLLCLITDAVLYMFFTIICYYNYVVILLVLASITNILPVIYSPINIQSMCISVNIIVLAYKMPYQEKTAKLIK